MKFDSRGKLLPKSWDSIDLFDPNMISPGWYFYREIDFFKSTNVNFLAAVHVFQFNDFHLSVKRISYVMRLQNCWTYFFFQFLIIFPFFAIIQTNTKKTCWMVSLSSWANFFVFNFILYYFCPCLIYFPEMYCTVFLFCFEFWLSNNNEIPFQDKKKLREWNFSEDSFTLLTSFLFWFWLTNNSSKCWYYWNICVYCI